MTSRERQEEQHNLAANGVKQCLSVQSLDSRVYCPLGTMGHSEAAGSLQSVLCTVRERSRVGVKERGLGLVLGLFLVHRVGVRPSREE